MYMKEQGITLDKIYDEGLKFGVVCDARQRVEDKILREAKTRTAHKYSDYIFSGITAERVLHEMNERERAELLLRDFDLSDYDGALDKKFEALISFLLSHKDAGAVDNVQDEILKKLLKSISNEMLFCSESEDRLLDVINDNLLNDGGDFDE